MTQKLLWVLAIVMVLLLALLFTADLQFIYNH